MRTHLLLRMIPVAVGALVLAGCASSGGLASAPPPPSADSQSRLVTDARYVAYVERQARMRGVEVVWVNPPTRIAELADAVADSD